METLEIREKVKKLGFWHVENKPTPGNEDEFREKVIDILDDIARKMNELHP